MKRTVKTAALHLAIIALAGGDVMAAEPKDFRGHATLTIQGMSDGKTVTDLPVLVRLTSTRPNGFSYDQIKSKDGHDMMFRASDGTHLPFEIDTWDTSGESLVWVKVPSASNGTELTMYWGTNKDVNNDSASVWSNDYWCVWHLGDLRDSTGRGYDLVKYSDQTVCTNDGQIGSAYTIAVRASNEDKGNHGLVAPNTASLDIGGTFTISLWKRHRGRVQWDKIVCRDTHDGGDDGKGEGGFSMHQWSNRGTILCIRGEKEENDYATRLNIPNSDPDVWTHYELVCTNAQAYSFGNGEKMSWGKPVTMPYPPTYNNMPIAIGTSSDLSADLNANNFWSGDLDEVRIRKTVVDIDRALADYQTSKDGDFLLYGDAVISAGSFIVIIR